MHIGGAILVAFARARRAIETLKSDSLVRQLTRNSGLLLAGSGLATLIGFFSSVLKARVLGPELFGLLAVVVAFAGTMTILATFQPWQAVIKYGAIGLNQDRADRVMATVKLGLLLDLAGIAIGTLACLLGARYLMPHLGWGTDAVRMGTVSCLLVITGPLGTPLGVLRLLDCFRPLAIQQVVTSVLGLIGTLAVWILGGGVWGFLWVQIGSQCVGTAFVGWRAWREMRQRSFPSIWKTRIGDWRPMVRFSTWTFFQSSTTVAVRQFDVLIAASVISLEAAGIYKVIKQLLQAFGLLTDPIYDASYPQFASLVAEKRQGEAKRHAVRLGMIILMVAAPVAFAVSASSKWWIPLLFGSGYSGATTALAVFLGFTVAAGATNPVHPLFLSFGYAKLATLVGFVTSAIYVALAIILGKQIGLLGIAIAYGVQNLTGSGLKTAYLVHRADRSPPLSNTEDAH